jgi:hypothetical protein
MRHQHCGLAMNPRKWTFDVHCGKLSNRLRRVIWNQTIFRQDVTGKVVADRIAVEAAFSQSR